MLFKLSAPFLIFVACFRGAGASIESDQLLTIDGSGQKASDEDVVRVTVVSGRPFDPAKNDENLKVVKDTIDSYSKTEGIKYPSEQIEQQVKDQGGKFAIVYTVYDADCEKVRRFIRGAKAHSAEVSYAVLVCPDKKPQIL